MDREGYMAIASMIRRNVPLAKLAAWADLGDWLDPDACRLICQSVPLSQHLRKLELSCLTELRPDTLDGE
jgi:hypothetical protein